MSTVPREPGAGGPELSTSTREALRRLGDGPAPAGRLVALLLERHGPASAQPYLGTAASNLLGDLDGLGALGVERSADGHLARLLARWRGVTRLTGRHVVLGLALDVPVGGPLVGAGVVGDLLARWTPGHPPDEPVRLAWDALSDQGRREAVEQPLLAAALGAPPEVRVATGERIRGLAWSERADTIAVMTDTEALTVRLAEGRPRWIGMLAPGTTAVGWRGEDVVGLAVQDGYRLYGVRDQRQLAAGTTTGGPVGGTVSGDGRTLWLQDAEAVWTVDAEGGPPRPVTSLAQHADDGPRLLGVEHPGGRGIVALRDRAAVVVPRFDTLPSSSAWPSDAAPLLGWTSRQSSFAVPLAFNLVALGGPGVQVRTIAGDLDTAPGSAAADPGLETAVREGLVLADLAIGAAEVTALAVDPSGERIAVGVAGEVLVWSIGLLPGAGRRHPRFDNDQPEHATDLLDTDRDAEAVAALLASPEITPPLTVGLFGDWGSGKSFLLHQVRQRLGRGRREGFLQYVKVVEFNAWQYAEANMWASLADAALRGIGPLKEPPPAREVAELTRRRQEATDRQAAEEGPRRPKSTPCARAASAPGRWSRASMRRRTGRGA
ncbi:P-loop NTPase fold protein, partial [Nocardioides sp. YIM 152588]|uniref:P-loop NTPase fold protein n=1 Tax=Nocardioides sp. YIM 152588 TaxID=3158259 RepID=UPI0032E38C0A